MLLAERNLGLGVRLAILDIVTLYECILSPLLYTISTFLSSYLLNDARPKIKRQ
ncbi:MAG: hypothetical protein Tp178MES00d2C33159091_49 [Prokaryotic dsDNA virus sp.]|nr:MAG: hypothetical protein Tp178MES00d2C33159091_49 [Prokaryotic dsDNA virus sp.]QDP64497.1 MAG: hypothetical protein Tp178SUR1139111_17 [Prokaryotic dsDNA virus sp.]